MLCSLGSRLSTIDRLTPAPSASARSSATDLTAVEPELPFLDRSVSKLRKILTYVEEDEKDELRKVAVEANSDSVGVGWVRTHLAHATVDMYVVPYSTASVITEGSACFQCPKPLLLRHHDQQRHSYCRRHVILLPT